MEQENTNLRLQLEQAKSQVAERTPTQDNDAQLKQLVGPERLTTIQSVLALATALAGPAAAFGAILYGLGFFVCSTYLTSIGTADFSLLKPRYISVGLTTLFSAWICHALMRLQHKELMADIEGEIKGWKRVVISLVSTAICIAVILLIFTGIEFVQPDPKPTLRTDLLNTVPFVIIVQIAYYWVEAIRRTNPSRSALPIHITLAVISCIAAYSVLVYPLISASWGGGRFPVVSVVPAPDKITSFESIFMLQPKSQISEPVLLIDEDDKSVLIRERIDKAWHTRVLRVDRDMIKALIYQTPR